MPICFAFGGEFPKEQITQVLVYLISLDTVILFVRILYHRVILTVIT